MGVWCFDSGILLSALAMAAGCATAAPLNSAPRAAGSFPADALVTQRALLTVRGRQLALNGYLALSAAGGKRLIVWRAQPIEGSGKAGTVLSAGPGLVVATGDGALSLREVQLEGKRALGIDEFMRGRRLETGRSLSES